MTQRDPKDLKHHPAQPTTRAAVAGAEGNAFRFVLEDRKVYSAFAEALDDGRFLKDAQKGRWELRFIPDPAETQREESGDIET